MTDVFKAMKIPARTAAHIQNASRGCKRAANLLQGASQPVMVGSGDLDLVIEAVLGAGRAIASSYFFFDFQIIQIPHKPVRVEVAISFSLCAAPQLRASHGKESKTLGRLPLQKCRLIFAISKRLVWGVSPPLSSGSSPAPFLRAINQEQLPTGSLEGFKPKFGCFADPTYAISISHGGSVASTKHQRAEGQVHLIHHSRLEKPGVDFAATLAQ